MDSLHLTTFSPIVAHPDAEDDLPDLPPAPPPPATNSSAAGSSESATTSSSSGPEDIDSSTRASTVRSGGSGITSARLQFTLAVCTPHLLSINDVSLCVKNHESKLPENSKPDAVPPRRYVYNVAAIQLLEEIRATLVSLVRDPGVSSFKELLNRVNAKFGDRLGVLRPRDAYHPLMDMICLCAAVMDNIVLVRDGMNTSDAESNVCGRTSCYAKCDRNGGRKSSVDPENRQKNATSKNCDCRYGIKITTKGIWVDTETHSEKCVAAREGFQATGTIFVQRASTPPLFPTRVEEALVSLLRDCREAKPADLREKVKKMYSDEGIAPPNEKLLKSYISKAKEKAYHKLTDDETIDLILTCIKERNLRYRLFEIELTSADEEGGAGQLTALEQLIIELPRGEDTGAANLSFDILLCDATHNVFNINGLKLFVIGAFSALRVFHPVVISLMTHEDTASMRRCWDFLAELVPSLKDERFILYCDEAGATFGPFAEVFPRAEFRLCMMHKMENLLKKFIGAKRASEKTSSSSSSSSSTTTTTTTSSSTSTSTPLESSSSCTSSSMRQSELTTKAVTKRNGAISEEAHADVQDEEDIPNLVQYESLKVTMDDLPDEVRTAVSEASVRALFEWWITAWSPLECLRRLKVTECVYPTMSSYIRRNLVRLIDHLGQYTFVHDYTQGLTTTAMIEQFFGGLKREVGRAQRIGEAIPRLIDFCGDRTKRVSERRAVQELETIDKATERTLQTVVGTDRAAFTKIIQSSKGVVIQSTPMFNFLKNLSMAASLKFTGISLDDVRKLIGRTAEWAALEHRFLPLIKSPRLFIVLPQLSASLDVLLNIASTAPVTGLATRGPPALHDALRYAGVVVIDPECGALSCTCPDYYHYGLPCVHSLRLVLAAEVDFNPIAMFHPAMLRKEIVDVLRTETVLSPETAKQFALLTVRLPNLQRNPVAIAPRTRFLTLREAHYIQTGSNRAQDNNIFSTPSNGAGAGGADGFIPFAQHVVITRGPSRDAMADIKTKTLVYLETARRNTAVKERFVQFLQEVDKLVLDGAVARGLASASTTTTSSSSSSSSSATGFVAPPLRPPNVTRPKPPAMTAAPAGGMHAPGASSSSATTTTLSSSSSGATAGMPDVVSPSTTVRDGGDDVDAQEEWDDDAVMSSMVIEYPDVNSLVNETAVGAPASSVFTTTTTSSSSSAAAAAAAPQRKRMFQSQQDNRISKKPTGKKNLRHLNNRKRPKGDDSQV